MLQSSQKRLLIVDDEPSILTALERFFSQYGFEVDCYDTVDIPGERISECLYDCALVDLCLGNSDSFDGLELVSRIRQHSLNTKIMVLTAYGTSDVEEEAYRRGANLFLHKPKSLKELRKIVGELMNTTF